MVVIAALVGADGLGEAIQIGRHIAIMDDGHIVQHGRPDDIITNPANDDVAEFVSHVRKVG